MKRFYFYLIIVLGLTILSCSDDNAEVLSINLNANRQATGYSANDLLSDNTFKTLNVELVYVEGFAPTQTTVNSLISFLQSRVYKPGGIVINQRSIPSSNKASYSIEELVAFEDMNRTMFNDEDHIAVWVYFSDGASSKDTQTNKILGTAYRNTSIVIFQETLQKFSNNHVGPDITILESTIFFHEFCHLFGLTNLGSPMQTDHEDSEHEKHCDEEDCLMFWSAEAGINLDNMGSGGTIPQLDSQCIADLRANGGK